MRSVPGVVRVAALVLTLPAEAMRAMADALVWLLLRSTKAPLMVVSPAARFCPWAVNAPVVLTLRLPALPRLPSDAMPAPSRLVAALFKLSAVMVVLPRAAITPVLLTAPLAVRIWLPAA